MNNGYTEQIRERINGAPEGSVFVISDFADIADRNTVKQSLNRMVHEGTMRRITRGVYDKLVYSELLEEYVAPDVDGVAKALARSNHWTIAPSGIICENLLGLSTQVPAVWAYVSDGPSRTYDLGNTKITFRHRTNREISGLSPTSAMVIQALKSIGKEYVSDKTIRVLSRRLNQEQKAALLTEGKQSTAWVYKVIREVCKGDDSNV